MRSPFILCLAVTILSSLHPAKDLLAGDIPWRTPPTNATTIRNVQNVANALNTLSSQGDERHVVVQFSSALTASQRQEVDDAGIVLLSYLGEHAYFASLSSQRLDSLAIIDLGLVSHVSAIDPTTKLHPAFAANDPPSWAMASTPSRAGDDFVVAANIVFHTDVPLTPDAESLCVALGATIQSHLKSVNALVIEAPFSAIRVLASEDAVSWIEPPLPPLSVVNDDARQRTQAEAVQSSPYGLDGSGVSVLVYDGGVALASHPDFGGRLTPRDNTDVCCHATHVAGTVGGDGSWSNGQYRGMAPGVTIESYGFEWDASAGLFFYMNAGDLEADYDEAINAFGASISNNSIGTNIESNFLDCTYQGDYGVTSALIDAIVRGSLGSPIRCIWANGNERQGDRCDIEGYGDYYSLAPPAAPRTTSP